MPEFKRPSLPPGPLRDLVRALHDLHLAAGYPSARLLQHDIGGPGVRSHTSIHKLFTEGRLPTWGLVELVVEALARRAGRDEKATIGHFKTLWDQATRGTEFAPEEAAPASTATARLDGQEVPETLSSPLSALLPSALDEWEAVQNGPLSAWKAGKARPYRIPTGFSDLDALLGGWSPGCLTIIGGGPSSGKTTLLLNFCRVASIKYAIPSMLISGEMNSTELQTRILSAEARVPLHSIRIGQMGEDDWVRLARSLATIVDSPINIATPPRYSFEKIRAEAFRLAQGPGLELLIIDGLQWITSDSNAAQSATEDSLWALKDLAVTLKVPVIVSAQAERDIHTLEVNDATQHLRDKGAIERVADIVIMLHRPGRDDPLNPRLGEADLIVAKHRNGPTARTTVWDQYHYCRFVETTRRSGAERAIAGPTLHDRGLYHRLLDKMALDSQIIDWLKNAFTLKVLPARIFRGIEQTAEMLSVESVRFDNQDAKESCHSLRRAIDEFCETVNYYTREDHQTNWNWVAGIDWLEVPSGWRDDGNGERYHTALTALGDARDALVKAYDTFLRTCHEVGIDSDGES